MAGEAEHPETSIPRAMRTMVLRLILFYVLAIAVMLMMTPWRELAEGGGGITGSPFVRAFAADRDSLRRRRDEPGRDLRGDLERELQSLLTRRMLLSLARSGLRAASLARGQRQRRPVARAGDRQHRRGRRDSAGGVRAGERLPGALRHGCRRHAVHLDRDPVHVSAVSRALPAGSAGAVADQDAGAPRRRLGRHRGARRRSR